MTDSDGSRQATCKFITRLPERYRVPDAVLTLPAEVTRLGLSQIINSLLSLDAAEPFDFLVEGQLLRSSLQALLEAHKLSTEVALEVEYIKAVKPPKRSHSVDCSEWVTSLAAIAGRLVACGDYAGALRFCIGAGELSAAFRAHQGPVTSVSSASTTRLYTTGKDTLAKAWAFTPAAEGSLPAAPSQTATFRGHTDSVQCAAPAKDGSFLCTGSWDTTMRLWPNAALEAASGQPAAPSQTATFQGHTDSVQCAAPAQDGSFLCTGSWDTTMRLWPTAGLDDAQAAAAPTAAARKRQKGAAGQEAAEVQEPEAAQVLRGHTQCVSGVDWMPDASLLSCSHDHSVRLWDVETGTSKAATHSSHQVHACAAAVLTRGVAAWAGADDAVHLWDVRMPGQSQSALAGDALKSHSHWVTDLAWHPTSPHQLLSASYDKTVKQWDVRAAVPLHTLTAHTDKVFAVCWADSQTVVSGGADSKLHMFTSSG